MRSPISSALERGIKMSMIKCMAQFHYLELNKFQTVDLGLGDPFASYKDFFYCSECNHVDPMNIIFMLNGGIFCRNHAPQNALMACVKMFAKFDELNLFRAQMNNQISSN